MTERKDGDFEPSFLPGRRFTSLADLNVRLAGRIPRANYPLLPLIKHLCSSTKLLDPQLVFGTQRSRHHVGLRRGMHAERDIGGICPGRLA